MTTHSRIRAIIVDDEPLARAGLAHLLASDIEVEVVAQCASGKEAIAQIGKLAPDLVLLDIQMPDMSGFEVVRAVGKDMPAVLFLTAYDSFAVDAFDVGATDYVLKPFDTPRFQKAMARAKARLRDERAPTRRSPLTWPARLEIREAGKVIYINVRDIDVIVGAGYCSRIIAGGRSFLQRQSLEALATFLDPGKFMRVHRSAIVNLTQVQELRGTPDGGSVLVLREGQRVKVARGRRSAIEERLRQVAE